MTFSNRTANVAAVLLCALFVVVGSLWIWRPGIQSDEALFAAGVYPPFHYPVQGVRIFQRDFAVMIMSYVGALKGHLWTPIFALWGTTPVTLRFPALIVGAISIWCFYRLLLRTLGRRVAIVGCALLATDPLYLLTVRWDWGPVALQHTFLLGGMLAVVAWWQSQKARWLGLAFFLFGLGIWDKALFIWSLGGLGAATLAVFPREVLRSLRWRYIAVAIVAFAIGAFPLIRYNVRNKWVTFRSNTVWTTKDLNQKIELLKVTLNGSALFGSIMREEWEQPLRPPETTLERGVVALSLMAGTPRRTMQSWLFALALLMVPVVWKTPARKAILFGLVFMPVMWVQMAFVENGGGGAHHTILLWPMPQLIIAASLGYASMRLSRGALVAGVVVTIACSVNLLVLSTYYTNLVRNGGVTAWTEAIYPVSDAVRRIQPGYLCVADWGFFDNLKSLQEGKVNMCVAGDPLDDGSRRFSLDQIKNPKIYFIRHTRGSEIQPGTADRIEQLAVEHGYRKVSAGVFADGNGRNSIEIFTFRPVSGS